MTTPTRHLRASDVERSLLKRRELFTADDYEEWDDNRRPSPSFASPLSTPPPEQVTAEFASPKLLFAAPDTHEPVFAFSGQEGQISEAQEILQSSNTQQPLPQPLAVLNNNTSEHIATPAVQDWLPPSSDTINWNVSVLACDRLTSVDEASSPSRSRPLCAASFF